MKILLVNNNTRHLGNLQKSLAGHDIEIQDYQPGLDFHWRGKDLVILSGGGGEGLEIDDDFRPGQLWYEDEMKFVKSCPTQIFGICMGFEIICRAYGAEVPKMDAMVERTVNIKSTDHGKRTLGTNNIFQHEAHQWHVTKAPRGFKVLADSEYGIELIQQKNITASQFHPEAAGSLSLPALIGI